MPSADENKAVVKKVFFKGFDADESRTLVTEDFRWVGPPSLEFVFDRAASEGPEALTDVPNIAAALYRKSDGKDSTNIHFMIAEGDIVILEFEATRTIFDNGTHRNTYCLVFLMRDGKIAEVHEYLDTHHLWDLAFDTPEKRDGVVERLGRLRV